MNAVVQRKLDVVSVCAEPSAPVETFGFYLVWNPDNLAPPVKMDTKKEAEDTAERLSKEHMGKPFYVLKTLTLDKTYMECVTVRMKTHFGYEDSHAINRVN